LISTTGPARKTAKKFSYRGVDLKNLFELTNEQLVKLLNARARRRFTVRGLQRKPLHLLQKLRAAKKAVAGDVNAKPEIVKTHLRDMIIIPEMIGSIVGVHNGKSYTAVEIKPEMLGHHLGEFSITYKPVSCCPRLSRSPLRLCLFPTLTAFSLFLSLQIAHGKAGIHLGAGARYVPL
jgi:small subunit ribosomal protein S15e